MYNRCSPPNGPGYVRWQKYCFPLHGVRLAQQRPRLDPGPLRVLGGWCPSVPIPRRILETPPRASPGGRHSRRVPPLNRDSVKAIIARHVATAATTCPSIAAKQVAAHVLRPQLRNGAIPRRGRLHHHRLLARTRVSQHHGSPRTICGSMRWNAQEALRVLNLSGESCPEAVGCG
jgi:hypothetical protein